MLSDILHVSNTDGLYARLLLKSVVGQPAQKACLFVFLIITHHAFLYFYTLFVAMNQLFCLVLNGALYVAKRIDILNLDDLPALHTLIQQRKVHIAAVFPIPYGRASERFP